MSTKQHHADRASQWVASGVSILNGMFGDYLHQYQNGLAIDMGFVKQGRALPLDRAGVQLAYPDASGRLCMLIHGLCCNERSWMFASDTENPEDMSYGSLLQTECGFTPFYVRYNTGRTIAENGQGFASLLNELIAAYPVPVEEIVLIGHSMGGLIIRSACEHETQNGMQSDASWLQYVSKAFYLGTPHEGADLEKFVHAATTMLDAMPNSVTRMIGDVLNLRSSGIKDLRDGQALGGASAAIDPESETPGKDGVAPWPDHMQHYLIAGTLNDDPQHLVSQLFGDGLVRMPVGRAGRTTASSQLPSENIAVIPGVHHMALAHDQAVYRQIKIWCDTAHEEE